jgi:heme/copper-type cytochrome/quinol oxidase subunit 2
VFHVLTLPQGKTVRLLVTSDDRLYDWDVPDLGIGTSAVPGRIAEIFVDPSQVGRFQGFVDDGGSQAASAVVVLEVEAFAAWEDATLGPPCGGE